MPELVVQMKRWRTDYQPCPSVSAAPFADAEPSAVLEAAVLNHWTEQLHFHSAQQYLAEVDWKFAAALRCLEGPAVGVSVALVEVECPGVRISSRA